MTENVNNPSVLVISSDTTVVETIIGGKTDKQQFNARETVQLVLDEPGLLENNAIVIFDIDAVGSGVDDAIDQAIKIKQADPTQVLMLVGEKDPLNTILKSAIQPMVYRAFNKPASPNQIFLAFKSAHALHTELVEKQAAGEDISVVGPAENRANINTLAAQRKTNPAIYAGIGVIALGIVGFLLFGGSDDDKPAPNTVAVDTTQKTTEVSVDEETASRVEITNELNQKAFNAVLDGRYVSPNGDNALEYYDQVLAIDPYDATAYEGRKNVADTLRNSFNTLVAEAKFDEALPLLDGLRKIEPLNLENDTLREDFNKAVANHVKEIRNTGSAEEIAKTTAVLERISDDSEGTKSATAALKAEKVLIGKIDEALKTGNLIPPQKDNAYSLVSDALKANKISKANSEPRVKGLSTQLLALANKNLEDTGIKGEKLEETSKLAALVKRLNVNRKEFSTLDKKINSRVEAIAAEQKAKESNKEEKEVEVAKVEEVKPEPPKILPAKVIKREPPNYPSRAVKSNTEGWVKVSFHVDTKGIPADVKVLSSEPVEIFDAAAVKSVKKWRFSPSRNQDTGLPVQSSLVVTTVRFKLG